MHWDVNNSAVDFYDIKGLAEDLLAKISLDNYELFSYNKSEKVIFDEKRMNAFFSQWG